MLIIGIVGGVASGKSLVADSLKALGAGVLDGDRAGHKVLEEPEVRAAIHRRWGDQVFTTATGEADRSSLSVDRKALAKIVFAPPPDGPRELEHLEQLTHPRIRAMLEFQAAELAERGMEAAVLDAPVLMKAGWDSLCEKIVFVDAPREIRLARARERGWSDEEFQRREDAQKSLDVKRSRADVVIDNSASPESTQAQLEKFWYNLF